MKAPSESPLLLAEKMLAELEDQISGSALKLHADVSSLGRQIETLNTIAAESGAILERVSHSLQWLACVGQVEPLRAIATLNTPLSALIEEDSTAEPLQRIRL